MTILLVRHAEPEAMPSVDPREWGLSRDGRIAATALRARLPATATWVSSTESKARETLACAGGEGAHIAQHDGFDEVGRNEPFDDGYLSRRLAWVEGRLDERHSGWETPAAAAARFGRAIRAHARRGSTLVVASHGMVFTAWLLHEHGSLEPHTAGEFWRGLAFPDVIEVR